MATTTHTTPTETPSRRGLLKIAAPAAAVAALASYRPAHASGVADAATGPDAELIRLCAEYTAAVAAYNADGGYLELEDDPLWLAVEARERRLDGLAASTLAGVVAKARVASCLARQLDGGQDFCPSFTGEWPGAVVRDLLALADGGAA